MVPSNVEAMLSILLDTYHPSQKEKMVRYLPEKMQQATLSYQSFHEKIEPSCLLSFPEDIIKKTHYSWFVPIFQICPNDLKTLYLSSLPESKLQGVCRLLNLSLPKQQSNATINSFFYLQLLKELGFNGRMPQCLLPKTKMCFLVDKEKNDLIRLIDYLSMQDLAKEIRQIVDKKMLRKIVHCLSDKKKRFLQLCLRRRDKLRVPPLGLNRWNGRQRSLLHMLHKRGLMRFGKALCGEHPDLIWYILHTLDTGRAKIIDQYIEEKPLSGITETLQNQILFVNHFLTTKKV